MTTGALFLLQLFARELTAGMWTSWGNEVLKFQVI
jgi:hypothetical protein